MPLITYLKEHGLLDAVVVREDWKWNGNRVRCSSCWRQNQFGFHSQLAHDNHIQSGKPVVEIKEGRKTCTTCLQKRRVIPSHTE